MLDRPSTHRLLELYVHTVPLFGHSNFVSDSTFEANHQPLKSTISSNTCNRSYVSAVYQTIAKDWFRRVYETRRLMYGNDECVFRQGQALSSATSSRS